MNKFRFAVITLLSVFAVVLVYVLSGFCSPNIQADYEVALSDPGTGSLDVSITISPTAQPFLHVYLRDSFQDQQERVTNFIVTRSGQPILSWQTLPGFRDVRSVWLGFSHEPVVIKYRLKALWMQGPRSPRSYLDEQLGYVRGMTTLFTPLALQDMLDLLSRRDSFGDAAGHAHVHFDLPNGWELVSPWGGVVQATPVALLRNIYFGMGKFTIAQVNSQESTLYLGIFNGLEDTRNLQQVIPRLFVTMQEATGVAPDSHLPMWALTILPEEVLHGGASGTNSLIVLDDLVTVAHEMFHWWNGVTIQTSPDANWLKEGFTTYYAGKMLYQAEVWSSQDFNDYLARQKAGLWQGSALTAINLREAAERLVRQGNEADYAKVYSGGALLANYLDHRLQEQGAGLDVIWKRLKGRDTAITTEDFLQELDAIGGSAIAQDCADIILGRKTLEYP